MNSHPPAALKKPVILGCGHSHTLMDGCRNSHPSADFMTVDMNAGRKPDIVMNIRDVDALRDKIAERNVSVSTLIFEYCPLPDNTTLQQYQELLDIDGYIILIGVFAATLDQLEVGHKLWICQEKSKAMPRTTIIIPRSPNHAGENPNLDPAVTKYLCNHLNVENQQQLSSLTTPHVISEKFKSIMPDFREHLRDTINNGHIATIAPNEEAVLFLSEKTFLPPTKKEMMEIIDTYRPGFFRRHVGKGTTEDLAKLVKYLEGINDPLTNENLIEIVSLIANREQGGSRTLNSLFVLPDKTETTRIFTAIYQRVDAYLLSCNIQNTQRFEPPSL